MKQAWIGAGFGLTLLGLGVVIAGAGHGIYGPLYLAGSPLPGPLLCLAAPVLWMGFAWLSRRRSKVFAPLMVFHYIAPVAYSFLYNWITHTDMEYPSLEKLRYFES